ncbi:hypothetical protein GOBAR_DD23259 [Gossypium barbadense]|nr:hypothetical protein GOBAR_DD23259 [Gossypium barbadense]
MPRISKTTKMGLQLTVGNGALPRKGLGRHLQGRVEAPVLKDKHDRFGLEVPRGGSINEELGSIHAICEKATEGGTLFDIHPSESRSVLNNWTAEEIPIVFRTSSE